MKITGLNHIGLVVENIETAKNWFVDILKLEVIDDRGELILLGAGDDVLAIKTKNYAINKPEHGGESSDLKTNSRGWQSLDHYGFFASSPDDVDDFAKTIKKHNIEIIKGPYDRSDGRSVYFRDPCGMVGEYFFYLPNKK